MQENLNMESIPVLIVGAGPTGLTAALELARHGIKSRILDKLAQPLKTSNALAVQARTLEVWQDMGILERALAMGNPIHAANFHTHKKKIGRISFDDLDSAYP